MIKIPTILFIFALSLFSKDILGRDLAFSLAKLPEVSETRDKGMLVDLLKEMQKVYTEGKISWDVYPFERSLKNVMEGKADIHMPLLKDKLVPEEKLPFSLSSKEFIYVTFLLYTKKGNNTITPSNLHKNNFRLETDSAHTQYFHGFKIHPTTCIGCALKKISTDRLDGLIFASQPTDMEMNKMGLNDKIQRSFFQNFPVHAVIAKGERSKEVDKIFLELFAKVLKNGGYDRALGPWVEYNEMMKKQFPEITFSH